MKILIVSFFVIVTSMFNLADSARSQTPASLALQLTNGNVQLGISGTVSNACTVQYATNLTQPNAWHYQANFQLTSSPALFLDTNQPPSRVHFYRVFTQQLPTNVVPVANMIWVSPGTFIMGSPTNEAQRDSDETQYTVTLTQGFFMGKFLVTQGDFQALVGFNPSYFNTNNGYSQNLNLPVETVSWDMATNYCALLTQQEMSAGRLPANWSYRLPTESEWEYACRAGTTTALYYGNSLRSGMANFNGQYEYDAAIGTITNSAGIFLAQTTPVGSYEPNAWGLSDMCGNVFQWCLDWYSNYPSGSVTNPAGPATGTFRVFRGGGWDAPGLLCRSAQRTFYYNYGELNDGGFRIVLAPNP